MQSHVRSLLSPPTVPQTDPASLRAASLRAASLRVASLRSADGEQPSGELRKAFDQFVGETFYGMMLKSMRKSLGDTPYFNGGRAEEIFQGQLDQMLSEKMTEANAESFTGPMFELFNLRRQ